MMTWQLKHCEGKTEGRQLCIEVAFVRRQASIAAAVPCSWTSQAGSPGMLVHYGGRGWP